MAPYDVSSWGVVAEPAIHVALGMGFGFVLERAGFGSAKKLTNQFYLNDMTVLKVMFTAIITAMILVLVATTFGWLDFERIWVNPTYLGSGILGGLLFGVGFVVGGYCPGTALVSAATLKVDGLLFSFGVIAGIFLFGYTEPYVDGFWNDSGNFGRLTLFDWLGISMPVTVLLAIGVALLFFAGGEWVERLIDRKARARTPAERKRLWRPLYTYAALLVTIAAAMSLAWAPTGRLRSHENIARIDASLRTRQVFVDPRELAELMADKRLALALLDLRAEASYNQFHLVDARRIDARVASHLDLPQQTVKVLLDDDESQAVEVYRQLALNRVENLYILAGGIGAWHQMFDASGCAPLRLAALGDAHPQSRPPKDFGVTNSAYLARVKRPGLGKKKAGGGCGG